MNKYNLITEFFTSPEDAIKFFVQLSVLRIANNDATCIASLEKGADKWTYILQWKDGRFVGEYIKPFRPSKENIEKFNAGCFGIANQLERYIDANDAAIIESEPSPFGDMAFNG
jgi:hypothetical protein